MKEREEHLTEINQYVDSVLSGKRSACQWERLACQRHADDLKRAESGEWDYRFDLTAATRPIRFIELLPHTKGKWARMTGRERLIKLEPWQKFIVATIFGWVNINTGLRRYRSAYICVPRKNGKSILAAGIGLYMMLADNEFGAEVYSGATSEKQAWEVFRPAKLMVERTPKLRISYGVEPNARDIVRRSDASRFQPVIGKPGDGASPSCAIVDEYHEHPDETLYETMETGMGSREQPLMLVITTAGSDISGPCYILQQEVQKVLQGSVTDEQQFGIIYTIDETDDWSSEAALIKANPNYGISVGDEFLTVAQTRAVQSARKQNSFKTKHLNLWVSARSAWMNMEWWNRQANTALHADQFHGEECWIGLDLSSKLDITAAVRVFRRIEGDGRDHYYLLGRYYLPEEVAEDPERAHYAAWSADGHIISTEGNIIDYAAIEEDLVADSRLHDLQELCFDPWGSVQLIQRLQAEHDITATEIPQNVKHISDPMKWVEALCKSGRLHHDGNPVMNWMISNIVVRPDANDNIYPRKERAENKIDGPAALFNAMSRAYSEEAQKTSVYEERGVMVL